MLEKNRMTSKIIFIALVVFFITTVSHAQGIFGNSSSSSNSSSNQTSIETNTTNNTTNNTMVDSSQDISNTNTTDNSSIINIESSTDTYNVDNSQVTDHAMGNPNIPPPMGDPNQDMYNVDNSQITGQASPRWVRDIDWAACVQKRFNDGESFMASRGACK